MRKKPAALRLALYDPTEPAARPHPVGVPYLNTRRSRRILRTAIQFYCELADKHPDMNLSLGVFPYRGGKAVSA